VLDPDPLPGVGAPVRLPRRLPRLGTLVPLGLVESVIHGEKGYTGSPLHRRDTGSEGWTSKGGPLWDDHVLRRLITNALYRPHGFEEIAGLVTPEVAARLDPVKEYGIQWFNRRKASVHTVTEPDGNGGRRYRKRNYVKQRPREEWIAVPVPAHLPRNLVDRARSALENSKGYERKGLTRGWELRGLVRCSCGSGMGTQTSQSKGGPSYHYYTCVRRRKLGKICTCTQKSLVAINAESTVWGFISDLLQDPKMISAGMETLIEQERATGPQEERLPRPAGRGVDDPRGARLQAPGPG
jgi:hypothetical protein